MEATYQITPEMVGLNWRTVLTLTLRNALIAFLLAVVLSRIFYGRFLTRDVLIAVIVPSLGSVALRVFSRTRLRITDNSIEELDGPVIRNDEIALVNEHTQRDPAAAALPQYKEIRQVVQSWVHPQSWHVI